jgi:hypothetical protein
MALASGTYKIVSAFNGDNHVVQNNNGLFQLEVEDHGASNDQKFQVTLTGDGSYSIYSLDAGANSGIGQTAPQDIGPDGVQALIVIGNSNMRWNIQPAPNNPVCWNIVTVPPNRQMLWNRVDPDNNGRLQLMNAGPQDSHNNWGFKPA